MEGGGWCRGERGSGAGGERPREEGRDESDGHCDRVVAGRGVGRGVRGWFLGAGKDGGGLKGRGGEWEAIKMRERAGGQRSFGGHKGKECFLAGKICNEHFQDQLRARWSSDPIELDADLRVETPPRVHVGVVSTRINADHKHRPCALYARVYCTPPRVHTAGFARPTSGRIFLHSVCISRGAPHNAIRRGQRVAN